MAGGVKEHSVFRMVCASFASPDEMMAMPSSDFGDSLVAQWADSVLLLPDREKASFPSQVPFHLHVETFFKVRFPGWIKWVGCSLYKGMPLDLHIGRFP